MTKQVKQYLYRWFVVTIHKELTINVGKYFWTTCPVPDRFLGFVKHFDSIEECQKDVEREINLLVAQ